MPALETLALNGTGVSADGLRHIVEMPSLRTLVLDGVQLSDQEIQVLSEFKQIEQLYADASGVGHSRRKWLESQIPACAITWF
jgi:hypothetical protein